MQKVLFICMLMLCPMVVLAQENVTTPQPSSQPRASQWQQRTPQKNARGTFLGRFQARIAKPRAATPANSVHKGTIPAEAEEQSTADAAAKLDGDSRQADRMQNIPIVNNGKQTVYLAVYRDETVWSHSPLSSSYTASSSTQRRTTSGWWSIEPGKTHVIPRSVLEKIWVRLEVGGKEMLCGTWQSDDYLYHPHKGFVYNYSSSGETFYYADNGSKVVRPRNLGSSQQYRNYDQQHGWKLGRFFEVPKGSQSIDIK